jgi:hypothetical protein
VESKVRIDSFSPIIKKLSNLNGRRKSNLRGRG